MLRFGFCKNTGRSFSIYCIMLYSIEECTASTSALERTWRWRLIARYVTVSGFLFLSLHLDISFHFFPPLFPALSLSDCIGIIPVFPLWYCGTSYTLPVSQSWLPFPLLIGSKQHGCLGTLHGVGTYFYPAKKKKKKKKTKQNNNTWLKMMPLTLHTVLSDKRCSDILVTGQSNAHS